MRDYSGIMFMINPPEAFCFGNSRVDIHLNLPQYRDNHLIFLLPNKSIYFFIFCVII